MSDRPERCPTCTSPQPRLHPSVQYEGEVQLCRDSWHDDWRAAASRLSDVYAEIRAERERAHAKHGDTSMENLPVTDMTRLSVLVEEVGEVAREFNEARHRLHRNLLPQVEREQYVDLTALREELIQVAAMAAAWADRIEEQP